MNSDAFRQRLLDIIQKERSRSAFAKKCGVSESLLRNYLAGPTLPSIEKAAMIADAAGVSLLWLIEGVGGESKSSSYKIDGDISHPIPQVAEAANYYAEGLDFDLERQLTEGEVRALAMLRDLEASPRLRERAYNEIVMAWAMAKKGM